MKTKKILFRLFNLIWLTFIVLNLVTSITGIGGICSADGDPFSSMYVEAAGSAATYTALGLLMGGIPLLILLGIKLLIIVGGFVGQLLMYGIYSGFEGSWSNWVTLEDIIFAGADGRSTFLDVNFFDITGNKVGNIAVAFRTSVAQWYYILRLISAGALLVILIYVGIRMALSTVGEEKAKYKEMFMDWVQSVALLFLLHYIILFFVRVNSAFVEGLAKSTEVNVSTELFTTLLTSVFVSAIGGIVAAVVYLLMVGQIFKFFILYVKRMITVGFLIMISPLITITYAIDKIGDGKAQALNAWLKELAYNILIQPFHCILFMAFYSSIARMISDPNNTYGIAPYVFVIFIMNFMGKAEEILKHIFHFEARHMSSMADAGQTFANYRGTFANIGKNVTKGAAAFKAAGGFDTLNAGLKDRKATKIANKATKAEYNRLKDTHDSSVAGMKNWKEYRSSKEGKEFFETTKKTTAKNMKTRAEKWREKVKNNKIEKAVKEKIDDRFGEGAYDRWQKSDKSKVLKDKDGVFRSKNDILENTRKEVLYDASKKDGEKSYQERKDEIKTEENKQEVQDFKKIMEPGKRKIEDALQPSASTYSNPSIDDDGIQAVKNKNNYTDANGKNANFEEIKNQLNDSTISEEQKEKLREQINKTYYEGIKNANPSMASVPSYDDGKKASNEVQSKAKKFDDDVKKAESKTPSQFRSSFVDTITGYKKPAFIEHFTNPTTDYGKIAKAAFEDSSKVVGAIVLGGITFGATDNMQDAISAGQLGYGLVDGIWENSTKTAVNDGVDKMDKLLQVLGANHEETKKLIEEIKEQNALGMFKDMGKVHDDFKKSLVSYLGESTDRNKLVTTIQRDFIEEGKKIDIETYMEFILENSERKDLVNSDADKIRGILQGFLDTMGRAEVAKTITTAESTGIRSGTFGNKVEKGLSMKEAKENADNS